MAGRRKVIGSERRADADIAPVQEAWNTDKLNNADPDFAYQFMRENEVHDRTRSKRVLNRNTGETVRISGWQVCQDGDAVEMAGSRPDLGAPIDSTMRMGPHVLMKIPKKDHDLLLHEKDAIADAHEARLMRGGVQERIYDEGMTVTLRQPKPYASHPAIIDQIQEQ